MSARTRLNDRNTNTRLAGRAFTKGLDVKRTLAEAKSDHKVPGIRVVPSPVRDVDVFWPEAPLEAPGRYQATARGVDFRRVFGRWKAVVEWTVLIPDDRLSKVFRHVTLYQYHNVSKLDDGRFCPPLHGSYRRDWILLAQRRPLRRERLSRSVFVGAFCDVEVATVTHDSRQRALPEHARYSKVARIITHVAGGGR